MNSPYNANAELVAMKEDIANRHFRLELKTAAILGIAVVGSILLGVMAAPMLLGTLANAPLMGVMMGAAVGLMGGGSVAQLATMKEREKLKIDQSMVDSYMQGKGHWGEGYREEVAEHGYSLAGPVIGHSGSKKHFGRE